MDNELFNRYGRERISDRQIDELIGLAKGIAADGQIHHAEVEFLQSWLAANLAISDQPLIGDLYRRVATILSDGIVDEEEKEELLETLQNFTGKLGEIGEALKSTTLPLCKPAPEITFPAARFCFTGAFIFGSRKECEAAVTKRGAVSGSLIRETNYLVIGTYVTDSWKHSSHGLKILKAVDMKARQIPIAIVSEDHWKRSL